MTSTEMTKMYRKRSSSELQEVSISIRKNTFDASPPKKRRIICAIYPIDSKKCHFLPAMSIQDLALLTPLPAEEFDIPLSAVEMPLPADIVNEKLNTWFDQVIPTDTDLAAPWPPMYNLSWPPLPSNRQPKLAKAVIYSHLAQTKIRTQKSEFDRECRWGSMFYKPECTGRQMLTNFFEERRRITRKSLYLVRRLVL